jgi:hypothetical protein
MLAMADWRNMSDAQLLEGCRLEAFRGPGPGGQKRNKTSSAVRLTHEASGISVIAGESRSQGQNKAKALKRLRHRMAIQIRQPFDAERWRPSLLDVSLRSEEYPRAVGTVLDVLAESGWSVSRGAEVLGVSTAKLVGFVKGDKALWTEVNRQRSAINLSALR